jgi:hypothetical protein
MARSDRCGWLRGLESGDRRDRRTDGAERAHQGESQSARRGDSVGGNARRTTVVYGRAARRRGRIQDGTQVGRRSPAGYRWFFPQRSRHGSSSLGARPVEVSRLSSAWRPARDPSCRPMPSRRARLLSADCAASDSRPAWLRTAELRSLPATRSSITARTRRLFSRHGGGATDRAWTLSTSPS